jgi:hypothetical protein
VASPTSRLLADLEAQGLLPPAQTVAILEDERTRPFSLHYELRALLFLSITLLVGGLGVLVYQHLDSIGHEIIVAVITLAMVGSFSYAHSHHTPFTWGEVLRTTIATDYLLLFSCLLFLVLEGYLQTQYELFGTRYGLATVPPAVLFFYLAYRFDHRGVLSMAITALAAWVGVSVAPFALFTQGFPAEALSAPGLLLGLGLVAAGLGSELLRRKPHFAYTYMLLGSNMALLAAMVRLFEGGGYGRSWPGVWRVWLVALLVLGICAVLVWYARRTRSYVFLLLAASYGYVAFSAALLLPFKLVGYSDALVTLAFLYFPISLISLIWLTITWFIADSKRTLTRHD